MKLLVDTHLILWAAITPNRLRPSALGLLQDETNDLYFSVASTWEVVVKKARGRPDFDVDPTRLRLGLLARRWNELPIIGQHVLEVRKLPPIHRDPFDRIMIAQARVERFVFLTADGALSRYGKPVQLV